MILKVLELENFQCYSGTENNKFEFSEGLNVIVGDNGAGKSKVFDAFYWVLYDEAFDTLDSEFKKTAFLKGKLVSDKSKFECLDGDSINTTVRLVFFNPRDRKEYTLERSYAITKKINDKGEVQWLEPSRSKFTLFSKEDYQRTSKVIDNQEQIDRIKRMILPIDIRPYMWFQGEDVDVLIDFKKHETLKKAINTLSDISEFDGYVIIAEKALSSAQKYYSTELRRTHSNKSEFDALEENKKRLEQKLERLRIEEKQIRDNLSKAEEDSESLLNKIEDAQKIRELEKRRKAESEQLKDLDNQLTKRQMQFNQSLFSKAWVLKGMEKFMGVYAQKFSEYERTRMQAQANREAERKAEKKILEKLKAQLPLGVPEPIYIEQMLDKERCMVCGRDAPKGGEAWEHLRSRIPPKTPPQKIEPLTKHNFHNELKKLYQDGLRMEGKIGQIHDDQINTLKQIKEHETRKKEVGDELEAIESDIQDLANNSSITADRSRDIINEYSTHNDRCKKYGRELTKITTEIDWTEKAIHKVKEDISQLEPSNLPSYLKEKVNIFEDFKKIAISTRDRVFNNLIEQLEKEANNHFQSMTSDNKSFRGNIKLVRLPNGNYMPENRDSNGQKLYQLNASNILLIKLSVIMAIISAKKGSRATDLYTLIADAPMSIFGENYTMGFCKTASEVYSQSIIMSKDFYKNLKLRDRLLSEIDKLGSVYLIEPSINERERSNRDSLFTRIKKLK